MSYTGDPRVLFAAVRHFIADDPPPAAVDRVARVFLPSPRSSRRMSTIFSRQD
jgi:uncharacterized protein (DUF1800 family)